jgi:hypothetical protein
MIGGVIYAALRGLVNDRCYATRWPQEETENPTKRNLPRIRYALSGNNEPTITGTDTTATDNTRAVIDVVAPSYGAMVTLRDQVIVALQSTDPPCHRDGDFIETWDPDTKADRCILQFEFHASTAQVAP